MDAHCQLLMDEYVQNKPSFEIMKTVVMDELKKILKTNLIEVNSVEGRVKAQDSLQGKLELKGYKYHSLYDITDIFGARIIVFYLNQVDKVATLIEQSFDIDWEDSVDKRKVLDTDQFGYLSLHYICRIPKSMYCDPEHPEVNEYRFEIQLRTALQHVWATANHDTGYKSSIEVPHDYIRSLNRLAGLLEIADKEFSTILGDITEYRRSVSSLIKDGRYEDMRIDGDTFSSYIAIKPFRFLNEKIAAINNAEIQEQSFAPYYEIMLLLGFKTIADIEQMKKECEDDAFRLATLQIAPTDLDILAETIGLQNLCIVRIIKNGGGENGVRELLDKLRGESSRNIRAARKLIEQATSLNIVSEVKEEPAEFDDDADINVLP